MSAAYGAMFGPDMPVPELEPLTAPFWSAARGGRKQSEESRSGIATRSSLRSDATSAVFTALAVAS